MTTKFCTSRKLAFFTLFAVFHLSLFACNEDKKNAIESQAGTGAGSGGSNIQTQAGAGETSSAGSDGTNQLPVGDTDFVSADGTQGQTTQSGTEGASKNAADAGAAFAPTADGAAGATARTVEEGDIYRVLDNNLILNLNTYRGIQIIDFSDPSKPSIIGRLALTGSPVELYVVDKKVIVLLNNWTGYYGSRNDVKVDKREGGLVATVDISNPTQPALLDQAYVPGYINTSRLTRGGDQAALYVAANNYYSSDNQNHTVVKSFDVSGSLIQAKTEIDLGGYVQDIQATTEALLVANSDYNYSNASSSVTIIDISAPSGTMVEGDTVQVAGIVNNKFNMDLYNGVLRIASGANWDMSNTNHVQTFDATDFSNLKEIDHCQFSDGQSLYATLFLGNKAFFVTYRRTDPFHAFAIGDDGTCQEMSQFIVSGWNDFFSSVFDDERLIGIGQNTDTGSTTMSVSLYDITNLTNANPLLARADVALDNSWSEATWDDKAYSVLEDALSPDAANGETGLILLPFQGWSENYQKYVAAVQIYTFSKNTLTRRGVMNHGSTVLRSFLADSQTTTNMSDEEMSFFDHTNPNSPKELGRVDLAPDYTQILSFGDYLVRLKNTSVYYGWWGSRATLPDSIAEVISRADNPDMAAAIATIPVPYSAYLVKAGNYLASVESVYVNSTTMSDGTYVEDYTTTIDVYDMSNPPSPRKVGTVTSNKLHPGYNYYYGGIMNGPKMAVADCMDCGMGWGGGYAQPNVLTVDGALVFVNTESQQKNLGTSHTCYQYPQSSGVKSSDCSSDGVCTATEPSFYYSGSISCKSVNQGPEVCSGEIQKCDTGANNQYCCEPIDTRSVTLTNNCYDSVEYRYWNSYSLYVLDLTSDKLQLSAPIEFPVDNEGIGVIKGGNSVYYSYDKPYQIKDDSKAYVRHYFVEVDLSMPSEPKLSDPVNVPGQLLAAQDDIVYTQDVLWGTTVAQSAINKLQIRDGLAYRQKNYLFANKIVDTVKLDGAGHVLVSYQQPWEQNGCYDSTQQQLVKLTVLDANDFTKLSETDVDSWATLRDAQASKALFEVSGGLLVMNLSNPNTPYMQAYFATPGWPQDILFEQNDILIAAGYYGIYRFNADEFNLISSTKLTQ
jgi:hypothetical protein